MRLLGPLASEFTLAQAQSDKLDRICRKVGLHEQPGMRLLDVGCGWGSLSLHAAEKYGAQVVGLTLSGEQKAYIDAALSERGLQRSGGDACRGLSGDDRRAIRRGRVDRNG